MEKKELDLSSPLPKGTGDSLETIGLAMIVLTLITGAVALLTMGKVTTVEAGYFGPRTSTEWSGPAIAMILASAAWTALLSFAVMRLGTAIRWIEAVGRKFGIE